MGASACSSVAPTPTPVTHYGAPIPVDASGTGGTTGNDAAPDLNFQPMYGGTPTPVDGGQK